MTSEFYEEPTQLANLMALLQAHYQIALAVLAVLVIGLVLVMRKRHLRIKIEDVPAGRLDTTPERSDILGPVKVKTRADHEPPELKVSAEPKLSPVIPVRVTEPVAAIEPVMPDVAPDVVSETVPDMPIEAPADTTASPAVLPVAEARPTPEPGAVPEPDEAPQSQVDLFNNAAPPVLPEAASEPEDVVYAVHVIARQEAFSGRELQSQLAQFGLHFGAMNIYHRHEKHNGQGQILFSLARAYEPGTFVPAQLASETLSGVSLFMDMAGPQRLLSYDLMVDTAKRLAKVLAADIVDGRSQVLLPEQLDIWREEIIAQERQRMTTP